MGLDSGCKACPLGRPPGDVPFHQFVPGEGPAPAEWMFVGEAPGVQEAKEGRPFVGPSGRLFDGLLKMAGLNRSEVYITNVVKHRPPGNRQPYVAEIKACRPFLEAQLEAVRPRVVVALGATAARWFLPEVVLEKDHGKAHVVGDYTVIPTYHPAYALRRGNILAVIAADFKRLQAEAAQGPPALAEPDYRLDPWPSTLLLLLGAVGFDTETTSPRRGRYFAVQEAVVVGFSVATAPGQASYFSSGLYQARYWLADSSLAKVCHNAKFEYGRARAEGIELQGFHDTKLAAWLLQYHSTHLKSLARQVLGVDPTTYKEITQGRDMSELAPEEIMPYACADADLTLQLWPILEQQLRAAGLYDLYEQVELPLIPVLDAMEAVGVLVNEARAQDVLQRLQAEEERYREACYVAGLPREHDVGSASQLAKALTALGCPIRVFTETRRQMKTDEEVLEGVRSWNEPLISAVLGFRKMRKLKAYAQQYLELRGPDGRLHPQFVQCGDVSEAVSDAGTAEAEKGAPVTGRLSCRGPNLQNQPKNLPEAWQSWVKELRRCIVPTEGWVLVSADISQEEPRITALVAPEEALARDFEAGVHPYAVIGELVYGRPITKQDEHEWYVAKVVFLATVYGAGWQKLMEIDPALTKPQAIAASRAIARRYPGLSSFYARVRKQLRATGEVRDWFQRRRWIPKVYSPGRGLRDEGYREGANFLIQGPAASVMKIALRRVFDSLRSLRARLLITVHDEVVLECPPEELDKAVSILYSMTEGIMPLALPVEVKAGPNWAEMVPFDRQKEEEYVRT